MPDLLLRASQRYGSAIALLHDDKSWTYSETYLRALQYAAALRTTELRPGDRVALFMENGLEYVAAYFGVFLAEGVAVPLDARTEPRVLLSLLEDSKARHLVASPAQIGRLCKALPQLFELDWLILSDRINLGHRGIRILIASEFSSTPTCSAASPADPAVINYTSGSSGASKGVVVSHRAILANARSIVSYLELGSEDRMMQILPFSYCYGASLLHTHFLVGGSVVIDNRFLYPSAVVENMKQTRCTGFAGVPSTFHTLATKCNLKKNVSPSLRYMTQAGGPMNPNLVDTIRGAIDPAQLYIMYGQTEATARLTYLDPSRWGDKRGSVGKPIAGVFLRIVSEKGETMPAGSVGEIWVSGENLMTGYWQKPEETQQVLRDGWLRTGDLGVQDHEGFLYVKGRLRDFIKSSGYRVSPWEIEEVVSRHPAVSECVVVGVPDEQLGERIAAVVSLRHGMELSQGELLHHCKTSLAPHKIPRQVTFLPEIPKSSSGKAQREILLRHLFSSTGTYGTGHASQS